MLNGLFVLVALASVLFAAFTNQMQPLTDAIVESARNAVDLAIGLVGIMAFFLGLMRIASDAGLMTSLSRAVSPVMKLLFPAIPANSPAMSAMALNISANMLGLGNAATPFGIKAIEELDRFNSKKGTATNAMVLFLAINTAGLAIIPSGMIAIRSSLNSTDAAGIFLPTWFASATATLVGVTAALLLSQLPRYRITEPQPLKEQPQTFSSDSMPPSMTIREPLPVSPIRKRLAWVFWLSFFFFAGNNFFERIQEETLGQALRDMASFWILPALVSIFILYGWVRRVRVYESMVEGAKEGFQVALRIIPYLVAILVVVGMFRSSGGLSVVIALIAPLTELVGMPPEVLPMAILRPLTGSGAMAIATETMIVHGPDSLIGYMVSTYQGSTETTFYVLAVYFGAVGVKDARHVIPACLLADIAGILAATFIVNLIYG